MNSSRDEVLSRIRGAIRPGAGQSTSRVAEYVTLPRQYKQSSSLSRAEVIEKFVDRLHDYGSDVCMSSESELPKTIANLLSARDKRSLLVPPGLNQAWLPDGFDFICNRQMTYEELDRAEGVATECALGIAATGSIVLAHSSSTGSRALTLIPDYHLCLVREQQVVETVPEGIQRMASLSRQPLTTIAGPSATADIEMTRVKGVHGPRTLDVILISI